MHHLAEAALIVGGAICVGPEQRFEGGVIRGFGDDVASARAFDEAGLAQKMEDDLGAAATHIGFGRDGEGGDDRLGAGLVDRHLGKLAGIG